MDLGLALVATVADAAEKKTVTQEILEILKASGTISDSKYEELLERVAERLAADRRDA